MWNKLRDWLIRPILIQMTQDEAHRFRITNELRDELRDEFKVLTMVQARLIAKIDPEFTKDHLDPDVRKRSDELGEQVIKRLRGEYKAMKPYNQ